MEWLFGGYRLGKGMFFGLADLAFSAAVTEGSHFALPSYFGEYLTQSNSGVTIFK